ncbi:hypothetical protein RSOLAG22IIIB_00878 [Rhizoctonia solani]|uniref:WW domain-containing protein n=1 Tax=Rhizoctonia solani TaxID=456999 RepID=A0A0K6G113_9AGAM|nr:hypothetical protein RSOLAG22IIIB_00878 [Rhizoctonia solani]
MTPKPRRYLPHGFQEKTTPDGRTYWISFRPLPPSWLPPADVRADHPNMFPEQDCESVSDTKEPSVHEEIRLPKGVEKHYTPSGSVYYVDSRPRASWVDPRTVDFTIESEREEFVQKSRLIFTGESNIEPPPEAHIEFRLLMDLTKWRVAQSLSGYPDARIDEVDTLIEMLNSRIGACPNLNKLKPMDGAFIKACYRHISSEADMASYGPSKKANLDPSTPTYA